MSGEDRLISHPIHSCLLLSTAQLCPSLIPAITSLPPLRLPLSRPSHRTFHRLNFPTKYENPDKIADVAPSALYPLFVTVVAAVALTLVIRLYARQPRTLQLPVSSAPSPSAYEKMTSSTIVASVPAAAAADSTAPHKVVSVTTATTSTTAIVPVLPLEVSLSYLAEGAANIIYRIALPDNASSSPSISLANRLLRLRKTLPSAQPNVAAYKYLSTTAFPLFPRHLLVATELIRLPPSLLARENALLQELEAAGGRPKKRAGMYLETTESHAFLVADMSPHTERQLLVEFKPKWVVQSPSAPGGARHCRTCALRLQKGGGRGFCPLDLASGDPERVRRAVSFLVPGRLVKGFVLPPGGTWEAERERLVEKVVAFLVQSELMPVLAEVQTRLDSEGPLGSIPDSFMDAMTVRDLTVFLRADMDTPGVGGVDCGIGDLDMKTKQGGKGKYWRDTELDLINGGWYEYDGGWQCEFN